MIQGDFHGFIRAKAIGSSGNYSNFVVETLHCAAGDLSFGAKPIQDERFMGAQHAGHLLHRFETAAHSAEAPIIEKGPGPDFRFILPEIGKGLFQFPGSCGGEFAGEQGIQLLPGPAAHPACAA